MRPYQPRLQNGLMKDSNSQHEETSGGRRDVARSASPQDRRLTKQAETKRTHKPGPVDATALRARARVSRKGGHFFGCDMNTFFSQKPSKSQILQPPHYQ